MKHASLPSRHNRMSPALCLGMALLLVAPLHGQIPASPVAPPVVPSPTPIPVAPEPTATPVVHPTPVGFTKTPTPPPAATREETMRLPLRKLIGLRDTMLLRNATSYYTIFVPWSARLQPKSCMLHFDFTNSIALVTERSVLRVVLNDIIIAQYYLDRNKPFNSVDVAVPLNVLKNGFNRLQFVVAQHYTYKCEDPSAPELYTEINPDTSYLSAVAEWREVPERLSYLRWWIDDKLWQPYRFNICLPGAAGQPSDLQLTYGSIVTQGVALALNNEAFRVSTASALRAGMDNIVIGTMNELSGFLTATEIGAINGPFLAIKSLPRDPAHCMIIISGGNEQEVGQAALGFGLVNFPLPDSQYAIIPQLNLPTEAMYIRNAPLMLPGLYSFRQLGFVSETIKGWHTGGYRLPIYMPGDISKDDSSNAELRLNFTYGAAMRKDSTFNVFVNRQFQTAIRLADQQGARHVDHRLYLPMKAFQPGRNTIELIPEMVPLFSNQCEILQDQNLQFTLYEDSEFLLPRALRKARLPSLGLFSQTTFPYSNSVAPDGSETSVLVAGRDPETICAAWTLLGKMAQISGALLHRAEVTFKSSGAKKNLLVVGARDQLPPELLAKAPVVPLDIGRMRYVVRVSPKPERLAMSPIEEFIEKIRGQPLERAEPPPPATADMALAADLVEDTVAIQFESPRQRGYPVTVITAGDSAKLLAGINALQDRAVWDSLSGDLAVWNSRPDSLAVAKVGPDFIYESRSIVSRVGSRFDQQPWLFAAMLIVILIIIGLTVRGVLRRREFHAENSRE